MDTSELDQMTLGTLGLLELRLQRLEFILHGDTPSSKQQQDATELNVQERIRSLEQKLHQLSSRSAGVNNVLNLYTNHPSAFKWATEEDLPEMDIKQTTATVLAAAPTLQSTASQLRALADTDLPPTASFVTWASLQPQIQQLIAKQDQQDQEAAELRIRSAMLVTRWHEVQVQAQMRCWIEYEERVRKAERQVRRLEIQRTADLG